AFYDGAEEVADELWRLATDMGWLGAATPERLGGLGLDPSAAFAILKECGRRAVPGAITSAVVAALWAAGLAEGSDLETIGSEVAAGELRPLIPALDWGVSVEVSAGALTGTLPGMMGWSGAKAALLPALEGGRQVVALVEIAEGSGAFHPNPIWDMTRKIGPATFKGARVIGVAPDEDGGQIARLRMLLQLALAADSVGGAENLLAVTIGY